MLRYAALAATATALVAPAVPVSRNVAVRAEVSSVECDYSVYIKNSRPAKRRRARPPRSLGTFQTVPTHLTKTPNDAERAESGL